MAFHEKAGPRQVDFDLPFLGFPFPSWREGVQSGPERSRARSLRRQRTLDGEDRSVTIPPGRKGSGRRDLVCLLFLCSAPHAVATLPSALSMSESSLGASWVFSFQPVLPPDYRPPVPSRDGSWARPLTQSPELGAGRGASNSINLNYAAAGNISRRLLRSGS